MAHPRLAFFCALLLTAACGGSDPIPRDQQSGPRVLFDPHLEQIGDAPSPRDWLAFPFPAEHRRNAKGMVDLNDFPNPDAEALLFEYFGYAAEHLDGFGTAAPVYMTFTDALDPSSLPSDPATTTALTSAVQLVDITPTSPEYGRRLPVHWELFEVEGRFVGSHTLAVAPYFGFPMRERTTYGLIITNQVKAEGGAALVPPLLLEVLLGVVPVSQTPSIDPDDVEALAAPYQKLADRLVQDGIDLNTVVMATVFTTQSVTHELKAIYDNIQAQPAPTAKPAAWRRGAARYPSGTDHAEQQSFQYNSSDSVDFYVLEGRYDAPNYQEGTVPYATLSEGGGFHFVNGEPEPYRTEELRFILTIPVDPPRNGADCYPIVEYAHGTTGSAEGLISGEAGRNAARGLATIGLDQPLHGPRWPSGNDETVSIYSFNFLNPAAGRTMFRQSTVDTFVLTRLLEAGLTVPASVSPTGQDICFDTEKITFFGHSHGGLSGALAAAFESDVGAWVISGAGGTLSITLIERNDSSVNTKELLTSLIVKPVNGEELTELHPVPGLVQLVSEVTDPINYSHYWAQNTALSPRSHVLLTSGEFDEATPHRTAAALAIAAGMPQVKPLQVDAPGFALANLAPLDAPVSNNVSSDTTLGFMQWTRESTDPVNWASHYVIFYRPEAINASMRFLESATFEAAPVLERDPNADVR